jgi:2-polyprenyl-3-methyl-5-hydroxy-6-metoxy-1,4-benzoquinol methylase
MLDLACIRAKQEGLTHRTTFVKAIIPVDEIPQKSYCLIVSNSLLHHLHNPDVLWQAIRQHSNSETVLFIADLCRPDSNKKAKQTVDEFAANEPEILRHDFYHSLLAAFRPKEIKNQLIKAGLGHLSIIQKGHHLFVYGKNT